MENLDYAIFHQKIHKEAKDKHRPLRVMFELTYACNFNCRHCYVPHTYRKRKTLSTADIFAVILQLKDCGCFYLGFTGGEIFTRPDIWKIIGFARKHGLELILYTNGSLINKDGAKRLSDLRVNKVDITIPAISEKTFESITGLVGSHKNFFNAIEYLKRYKVNLGFKTCLLKANQNEIAAIKRFCRTLNAPHRLGDELMPRLDGSLVPYKYRPSATDDNIVKTTGCFERIQTQAAHVDELFKCGAGLNQCAISPDGRLKLCLMINWPNTLVKKDFAQNWERVPLLLKEEIRNKKYPCYLCVARNNCKWCPAYSWLKEKTFMPLKKCTQ